MQSPGGVSVASSVDHSAAHGLHRPEDRHHPGSVKCCVVCGQGKQRLQQHNSAWCHNIGCAGRVWTHRACIGLAYDAPSANDRKRLERPDDAAPLPPGAVPDAWEFGHNKHDLSVLNIISCKAKVGHSSAQGLLDAGEVAVICARFRGADGSLQPERFVVDLPNPQYDIDNEPRCFHLRLMGIASDGQLTFCCCKECKKEVLR